jgi:TonB-linked SusC/RagA family outer membrane protein
MRNINTKKLKIWFILLVFFLGISVVSAYAQVKVSGTVTDADNQSTIPGVSISVKGTTLGTVTDINGKYSISVDEKAVLLFSFIGYTRQEIPVAGQSVIDISLSTEVKLLEQVVVTGYQSQKKADLTGAVTVVDVKELQKMPNNNPIQALQGRVPGMVVTTDGSPSGSNVSINIRGIGSINGTNPLYVIDGVSTTSGMHELNPNDIESIQVLKDASAASIYGSRASNGVIIITTKRAKKGDLSVTANAHTSFSWYGTKLSVLDAQGYGQAVWQASANDGSPLDNYLSYSFDWGYDAQGKAVLNQISLPEYIDPLTRTMKTSDTKWFDEISHRAFSQNYDVSVLHGTEKANSMFSINYTDNQGIVKTTDFSRISARLNTDFKMLNNKLKVGENFTLSTTSEVQDPGVLNPSLQALPIIPVHTVDGIGWGGPYGGMNDRQNPVRLLEDNKQNHYNFLRLFGNAYADLEIVKNLHFKSSLGLDYGDYYKRDMQLTYVSGYLNNPINSVTSIQSHSTKLTWTNTLNYNIKLGNHIIDAVAGAERFKQNDNNFWAKRQVFASEDPDYMYLDAGTGLKDNGGAAVEYRLLSYFGKVNYVYNEKYLASLTLRYDGSSRFGKNNQFGTFPAFNLGWRLNNENFIKDNFDFISDLKLRFGWGKNGSQDYINATASKTLYQTNYSGGDPTWRAPDGTAYDITGAGSGTLPSGYQIIQRSNDDLRWEATTQTNIGLDYGFFDQKMYGSIDYYLKNTSDMLVQPAYIGVIGEGGNRWVNGASMENTGFEFQLGYRGKIGNDLNYDFTGNFALYRNKITDLPESVVNNYGGNGTTDNILGHPWGSGYGYVADGLFTTDDEVANSAEQLGKGLGRIRYQDLTGDGTIDSRDQTWIYNPNPDFTYGFNFYFEYKGFDLTVFFQGVGPVDINVYGVKSMTDFWSINETGSNKGTRLLDAWSLSNPTSDIPALTSTDRNNETRFSTYFVENGSYMKLRNLQVGYTLPRTLTKKFYVNNLNLYISAQNVFTIKSKAFTGVDPETPGFGYPIPTMVTTGIKVSF